MSPAEVTRGSVEILPPWMAPAPPPPPPTVTELFHQLKAFHLRPTMTREGWSEATHVVRELLARKPEAGQEEEHRRTLARALGSGVSLLPKNPDSPDRYYATERGAFGRAVADLRAKLAAGEPKGHSTQDRSDFSPPRDGSRSAE